MIEKEKNRLYEKYKDESNSTVQEIKVYLELPVAWW